MRKGTPQVVDVPAPSPAPGLRARRDGRLCDLAGHRASRPSRRRAARSRPGRSGTRGSSCRRSSTRASTGCGRRPDAVRSAVDADLASGLLVRRARSSTPAALPSSMSASASRARAPGSRTTPSSCPSPRTSSRRCRTRSRSPTPRSRRWARSRCMPSAARGRSSASASSSSGSGCSGCVAVQILRAAGVRVAGVEPRAERRELASELGAEAAFAPDGAVEAVQAWTDRTGADAVLVAASGRSERARQRRGRDAAAEGPARAARRRPARRRPNCAVRARGRRPDLDLLRAGPLRPELRAGRPRLSDPVRALDGRPQHGGVSPPARGRLGADRARWRRSSSPSSGRPRPTTRSAATSPPPAAVLVYDAEQAAARAAAPPAPAPSRKAAGELTVAIVGAGSFTRGTHVPNLTRAADVRVKTVVSRRGSSAAALARSLDGAAAETDPAAAIEDPEVDLVLVTTRHDSHAELAAAALRAGKAVFLEKPLGPHARGDRRRLGGGRPGREARHRLQPPPRSARPSAGGAGAVGERPRPARLPRLRPGRPRSTG